MKQFMELLGMHAPNGETRLVLSLLCLLSACMLYYFWKISGNRSRTESSERSGLLFLALAFAGYAVLGIVSLYFTPPSPGGPHPQPGNSGRVFFLVISLMTNGCLLLALPFLDLRGSFLLIAGDKRKSWNYLISTIILILIITTFLFNASRFLNAIDLTISGLTIVLMGYVLVKNYISDGLRFMAILTAIVFVFIILLSIGAPEIFKQGRFGVLNITVLSPAIFIALLCISHTYSWFNMLDYTEISNIYTSPGENNKMSSVMTTGNLDSEIVKWHDLLVADNLEKVIEELILVLRTKKRSLEFVINLAARNNRNNTSWLKQIIEFEIYDVARNRIRAGVLSAIEELKTK